MNDLMKFKNEEFGEVRVAEKDGEAVFYLADVCKILDLDSSQVMKRLDKGGLVNPMCFPKSAPITFFNAK